MWYNKSYKFYEIPINPHINIPSNCVDPVFLNLNAISDPKLDPKQFKIALYNFINELYTNKTYPITQFNGKKMDVGTILAVDLDTNVAIVKCVNDNLTEGILNRKYHLELVVEYVVGDNEIIYQPFETFNLVSVEPKKEYPIYVEIPLAYNYKLPSTNGFVYDEENYISCISKYITSQKHDVVMFRGDPKSNVVDIDAIESNIGKLRWVNLDKGIGCVELPDDTYYRYNFKNPRLAMLFASKSMSVISNHKIYIDEILHFTIIEDVKLVDAHDEKDDH